MEILLIIGAVLGSIAGVTALLVLRVILSGWVLSVLWGWFLVPTLDLPQISIVQALGISLVIGYLTHQYIDCQKPERKKSEEIAAGIIMLIYPLIALFIGWIFHLFM